MVKRLLFLLRLELASLRLSFQDEELKSMDIPLRFNALLALKEETTNF
jgi:hypothetical protein